MKQVRLGARPKVAKPKPYKTPEEEEIGLVNGIMPDSREEYRVAVALTKYRIPFDYQVPIRGGSLVRGGQVVDFVVQNPFPTAVEVQGKHWHSGKIGKEETFKNQVLFDYFKREPILLDTEDLQTQEQANQTVKAQVVTGS